MCRIPTWHRGRIDTHGFHQAFAIETIIVFHYGFRNKALSFSRRDFDVSELRLGQELVPCASSGGVGHTK